jgi:hypothetical protein
MVTSGRLIETMSGNSSFIKSEATLAWLGQFNPQDQDLVTEMLRSMSLVSRDAFYERLILLIKKRAGDGKGPIGLYAEREVQKWGGKPNRLFKQRKGKIRRAHGAGPKPIQPLGAYNADVGSEGLVSGLISELCRGNAQTFLNHPGPDQIRKFKVRRFFLVTDFIGSGNRAATYLEATWRVCSVRSWWSARATKGMSFEVIAYSATDEGKTFVEKHRTRPYVHLVAACPTIWNSFGAENARKIEQLCDTYFRGTPDMPSLGYGSSGALIAFAHGAPNNTPLIFHKKKRSWLPLFPERLTAETRYTFSQVRQESDDLRARLVAMRQRRLARSNIVEANNRRVTDLVIVLAALGRPPRAYDKIALKTRLTLLEVEQVMSIALKHGWIDGNNQLTEAGQAELNRLRKPTPRILPLTIAPPDQYCPKKLRAPVKVV